MRDSDRPHKEIVATGLSMAPQHDDCPTWSRNPEVREFVIDNEGLLFHPVIQLLCHLNETAMFIWRNCEGLSSDALIDKLACHFRVEPATAKRHVTKTLELFSVSGFVAATPLERATP